MRQFTHLLLFICCQFPLLVFGQNFAPITANQDQERNKLNQNYNLWLSHSYLNYQYTYQRQCHECCWKNSCAAENFPWSVQFNTDYSISSGYTGAKAIDSKNNPKYTWLTIEAVFDDLWLALEDTNKLIEAQYDTLHGYPLRYRIQKGMDPNLEAMDEGSIYDTVGHQSSELQYYSTAYGLWGRAFPYGAPKSYQFSYTDKSTSKPSYNYPVTVIVEYGTVTGAKDSFGYCLSSNELPRIKTIDGWFNDISVQLGTPPADWVNNDYEANLGYPTKIKMIPYSYGAPTTTEIEISGFTFLASPYNIPCPYK